MPISRQNTATRTPLFSQHMPGGPYGYADMMRHQGDIFFVCSINANAVDDTGHGRSPECPYATLDYAVGQCTASQEDVIYLMPGHVEALTAAADLVLDVAGITIRGVGRGTLQPIIRFGTINTVDMDVTAANVTIENVNFQAYVADIVAAIDVDATDFTIRSCRFTEQAATLNALIWIQMPNDATAGWLTVEDCYVYAPDTANTHFINFSDTGDCHKVRRNVLHGDWGTMAIGGAGVITNANIADNYIYNLANTVDGCLNFAAGATGTMTNNMVGNSAAQANQIVAVGMSQNFNYGVDIGGGDVQGIPEPAMA